MKNNCAITLVYNITPDEINSIILKGIQDQFNELKKDIKTGITESYYENGQLMDKWYYKNGLLDGPYYEADKVI